MKKGLGEFTMSHQPVVGGFISVRVRVIEIRSW